MCDHDAREAGFTLVEVLVTLTVFAVASTAIYSLLLSVASGSRTSRSLVKTSEEARLGFNRMVRDTREGERLIAATPQGYTVQVDFNGDGIIQATPSDPSGDYERLEFAYQPATGGAGTITLNGEVLMAGVDCLRTSSGSCRQDVFRYLSNRLEYDLNGDGVTTWQELDASSAGNNDGQLNTELPLVSNIIFALRVTQGSVKSAFTAEAQMRNER